MLLVVAMVVVVEFLFFEGMGATEVFAAFLLRSILPRF